ncbi:MAG: hypothetical protein CVT64_01195 [Actinobacteria bacterium HGW-Actinobacteria-4]|nr:MAG: hypothetical protein CVT64_01195 [Actinobacteria bacterium HGW-Actinobacteria-4]
MFGRSKVVTELKGKAGKVRRDEALSAPASTYAPPGVDTSQVWLAAVEIRKPESHITYVSLADGTTSVYYATGKGYEGVGSAESVAEASRAFVERAGLMKSEFTQAEGIPYPARGKVSIYYRIGDGLFVVTATEDILAVGGNPLTPLYKRSMDVLHQANAVISR